SGGNVLIIQSATRRRTVSLSKTAFPRVFPPTLPAWRAITNRPPACTIHMGLPLCEGAVSRSWVIRLVVGVIGTLRSVASPFFRVPVQFVMVTPLLIVPRLKYMCRAFSDRPQG